MAPHGWAITPDCPLISAHLAAPVRGLARTYWVPRSRAPTAMNTTPMMRITVSGVMSTELDSIPRAAPTTMAMPTTNMTELRDMKPFSVSNHLGL